MADFTIDTNEDRLEALSIPDEPEDFSTMTQIQNRYTFWYRCDSDKLKSSQSAVNYKDTIKKIGSFQTVERFWQIYDHLKRPNEFKTTEFHLFKDGITPFWEDPQNKSGGKWMLRLRKGIAARYWEDILFAIIGEQFDVGSEICGAVLSVRINEDIISIWNKTAENTEAVNKIRDQIRKIVRLPNFITVEYKNHQDSLVDKSSYRNPSMVWRAPVKTVGDKDNHRGYNNYKTSEGRFNSNKDQQTSGEKNSGWKPRWSQDGNDAGSAPRKDRDESSRQSDSSAWRRPRNEEHGSSLKDSQFNSSKPASAGSKAPGGDGWTKVKNPFHKSDHV